MGLNLSLISMNGWKKKKKDDLGNMKTGHLINYQFYYSVLKIVILAKHIYIFLDEMICYLKSTLKNMGMYEIKKACY